MTYAEIIRRIWPYVTIFSLVVAFLWVGLDGYSTVKERFGLTAGVALGIAVWIVGWVSVLHMLARGMQP